MKKVVLLLTTLLLSCGEAPPKLSVVEANFYDNRAVFAEVEKVACQMGEVKQPYSYTADKFSYSLDNIEPDFRNATLDSLLQTINASALGYNKKTNGECSLVVSYFKFSFAGRGNSYAYGFQTENPNIKARNEQTLEKISEARKDIIVHMPLEDGWYIIFRHS
jgi:hypothetical protein